MPVNGWWLPSVMLFAVTPGADDDDELPLLPHAAASRPITATPARYRSGRGNRPLRRLGSLIRDPPTLCWPALSDRCGQHQDVSPWPAGVHAAFAWPACGVAARPP